ncbi:MAG TPA: KTSC domain-containing protein [Ferruginibacter sp.]|jgi:hypothetical protein|nr:KTSC domain-containing protein [Ferruginibacter sp.]
MPSTVIRSFKYIPETETLEVTFVSGISYKYFKVTGKEYEDLKNSFAKGIHFNRYIKPNHAFQRITGK